MVAAFWLVVAIPTLAGLYVLFATLTGLARRPRLQDVRHDGRGAWPRVTIVSPACNEERAVGAAMESMLATDYPDVGVVAIDDRSTDRTGAILDDLAARDPRLRALHVTELPDGWLGKLNALERGAAIADGDWLLFMDADAHLARGALERAVAYAEDRGLDCLSVVPEVAPAGWLADAVFNLSMALLGIGGRLDKVSDPSSPEVAATGAFILVRKATFDRTPGFGWLRLEVADDFGLALLIKSHGGRCDIVNGRGDVRLTWYASFDEMKRAMQKNFFAVMARFSLARSIAIALLTTWMALFPLAACLPVPPMFRLAPAVGALAFFLASAVAARCTGRSIAASFWWPAGFLAMAFMSLRAGIIGARLGGIEWRGVVYPSRVLAERQRVKV